MCAKSLHQHVLVKKDEPQQLPETHHQSQSQSSWFKRSRVSTQQTENPQLPRRPLCQTYSFQKSLSSSPPLSTKCHDSVNLDRSACVLSIGVTLAHWWETAICLCKFSHTLQPHQSHTLCYINPRLDR